MLVSGSMRKWLRLPSRIALLLGLGTVSVLSARAAAPDVQPKTGATPVPHGGAVIRTDGDEVYLSERGGEFRALKIGDTAEARYLRELLTKNETAASPSGLQLNPTILASGGGSGFHWNPFPRSGTPSKATASVSGNTTQRAPATPEKAALPPKTDANGTGKTP